MYIHAPTAGTAQENATGALLFAGGRNLFSAGVFLIVFLYFWIGLDPLPDSTLLDPTKAYGGNSNRFNQVFVLGMVGLVLFTVFGKTSRNLLFQPWALLFLVFGWLFFAAFVAPDPGTAFRRTVFTLIVCICANAVLLLPKSRDQFITLVAIALVLMLGLAYLTVTVLPHVGIHQASDPLEAQLAGDWRAHFGHKNAAAAAMVFAFFYGLYIGKVRSVLVGGGIALLALVFLWKSGSKTSTAMLPAILLLAWLMERLKGGRLLLLIGSLLTVNAILLSAVHSKTVQSILVSAGIDPTFTNRTSIWQLAFYAISESPLTGYGLQSFWQTDALFRSSASLYTWAVTAANSHNAYVELLINGGVPAFVLVFIWLVILPVRYSRQALATSNDQSLTRLFLRIWLFSLFFACLESAFFVNAGPIWFTMLIGVFGLRLQAKDILVVSSSPLSETLVVQSQFPGKSVSANPR
jgi:O-antigen ligase